MTKNALLKKIKNEEKIISVYGLGNVGGPIAAAWLRKGAMLTGLMMILMSVVLFSIQRALKRS